MKAIRTLIITTCGGGNVGPNYLYLHIKEILKDEVDIILCETIPRKIKPNVDMLLNIIH